MLAFNLNQKTGEIDSELGIVWEIVEFSSTEMKIQSIPPGEKENLRVSFIRE